MPLVNSTVSVQDVVRTAARQLVSLEQLSGGIYVTTPLLYTSGSYVVIKVEQNGDEYIVSDFGSGFQEAEFIAGSATYRRIAKNISKANGVRFDGYAFFVLRASSEQLPGAIATIANSSQEAVNVTSLKISEKTHRNDNEVLYDRLTSIFPSSSVSKDVRVVGASNTEWHVSSLVNIDNAQVAFEAVSKHPNSIVHTVAKFEDIARLRKAPGRVAVVKNKRALGTYLNVLTHSANVIERQAENNVYQRLLMHAA